MRIIREKEKICFFLLAMCLLAVVRGSQTAASPHTRINPVQEEESSSNMEEVQRDLIDFDMDPASTEITPEPVVENTITLFTSIKGPEDDELLRVAKASRSFGVPRKEAEEENIREILKDSISKSGVTNLPVEKEIIQKLLDKIRKEKLSTKQMPSLKEFLGAFVTNYTTIRSVLRENRRLHYRILKETLQTAEGTSTKELPTWIRENLETRTKAIFGYVNLLYDFLQQAKDTLEIRSTPDAILLVDLLSDMFDNLTEEVYEEGNKPYNELMFLLSMKIMVYIAEEKTRMDVLVKEILSGENITEEIKEVHQQLGDILSSVQQLRRRLDPSVTPEMAMGIVDKTGTRLIIDEYTTKELVKTPSVTAFKMEIANILGSTDISIFRQRLYNLIELKKKILENLETNQIKKKYITKEYIKRVCSFYREVSRIPYKIKYFSILRTALKMEPKYPLIEVSEQQEAQLLTLMKHITEWNLDTHEFKKVLEELDASYENLIQFYHQYMDKVLLVSAYLKNRKKIEEEIRIMQKLFRIDPQYHKEFLQETAKGQEKYLVEGSKYLRKPQKSHHKDLSEDPNSPSRPPTTHEQLFRIIFLKNYLDDLKDLSPKTLSGLMQAEASAIAVEVDRLHEQLTRSLERRFSVSSIFSYLMESVFKKNVTPLPSEYTDSISKTLIFLKNIPQMLERETKAIKGTREGEALYRETLVYLLPVYARINSLLIRIYHLDENTSRSPYLSMLRDDLRLLEMLILNTVKSSFSHGLIACSRRRRFFNNFINIDTTLAEIFEGIEEPQESASKEEESSPKKQPLLGKGRNQSKEDPEEGPKKKRSA